MSKLTEQCDKLRQAIMYKTVNTKEKFAHTKEEGQQIASSIREISLRIEDWEKRRRSL
jgi:hypothetical protein